MEFDLNKIKESLPEIEYPNFFITSDVKNLENIIKQINTIGKKTFVLVNVSNFNQIPEISSYYTLNADPSDRVCEQDNIYTIYFIFSNLNTDRVSGQGNEFIFKVPSNFTTLNYQNIIKYIRMFNKNIEIKFETI